MQDEWDLDNKVISVDPVFLSLDYLIISSHVFIKSKFTSTHLRFFDHPHCHLDTRSMALPQSLRVSITPPELELIASQQLIEIVPLISMERTAFISVLLPCLARYGTSVRTLRVCRVHMVH